MWITFLRVFGSPVVMYDAKYVCRAVLTPLKSGKTKPARSSRIEGVEPDEKKVASRSEPCWLNGANGRGLY